MQQGSYYRRSSVYAHRRRSIMRPARLAVDIVKVPTQILPVVACDPQEDFSDIVLPAKRPTPSIIKRTERLPELRHHTAL